ncbi:MAG: hypothetical protein WCB92_26945 [Mycobacterium sp.]
MSLQRSRSSILPHFTFPAHQPDSALKMALWRRDHADRRLGDGLIHHSDAGQYTSIAFAETLVLEGIAASIGSIGDVSDKGLAS